MSSDAVVKEIAARLKKRKDLDSEVVKTVTEALLNSEDPIAGVETLDTQLYKIAMRRAEKK